MKSFLWISLALGLIAMSCALTCNTCKFRALSFCFSGSGTESCTGNCSLTKASIGSLSLFSKQGCTLDCKPANSTDNVFNFDYATSCCLVDQCNSGNSFTTSLSLGLGVGLLWLLNAL